MNFSSILDQPTAVRTLQSALKKERVAHAYLFIGPSGVGRKLTAKVFAAALNCEGAGALPCGQCAACRLIADGRHPDVQTIVPTKRSSTISVEQIESILPFVYMRPVKGKNKVFIFSEADRLGLASANKMLKMLEEPPSSTIFILVTERPENMLPTVSSRCQPVKFGRLHAESVKKILTRNFHIEPARAALAAELADGQVSRGLQFADPERSEAIMRIIDSLNRCSDRLNAYDRLLEVLASERLKLEEQAQKDISVGEEEMTTAMKNSLADMRKSFIDRHYREFLNDSLGLLLSFYRDVLVMKKTGADKLIVNRDRSKMVRDLAGRMSVSSLLDNVKAIEECTSFFSHYVAEDRVFLDLLQRLKEA